MSSFIARLRRRFCAHEAYIEEIERHDHETKGFRLVEVPCIRCGKVLTALYGLALPAKLLQRPTTPKAEKEAP